MKFSLSWLRDHLDTDAGAMLRWRTPATTAAARPFRVVSVASGPRT